MTTKAEIATWFDEGVADGAKYMIVVCDTFDHEDYPVYALTDKGCLKKYDEHNGPNMQRVMEVYNLTESREEQLNGRFTMRLPERASDGSRP